MKHYKLHKKQLNHSYGNDSLENILNVILPVTQARHCVISIVMLFLSFFNQRHIYFTTARDIPLLACCPGVTADSSSEGHTEDRSGAVASPGIPKSKTCVGCDSLPLQVRVTYLHMRQK